MVRARQAMRGRAPAAVRGGIARDDRSVLFGGARRRRLLAGVTLVTVLGLAAAGAVAVAVAVAPTHVQTPPPSGSIGPAPPAPTDDSRGVPVQYPVIEWRESRALGKPWHGRLVRGVQLPASGPDWFSWDPVLDRVPDRAWRRWGTAAVLRSTLAVLREYRAAADAPPRVGIADIARQHGGWFGKEYGGLGHASHQNGLDIDILYPRKDERERRALRPAQVDQERAQALVDGFVEAGAEKIFVGPHLDLHGPRGVVIALVHHDDHLHVRMPPPPE